MDPPFEASRTATFFRILGTAIESGHNIQVFAYEGAVSLSLATQKPHGNVHHGRNIDEEAHPLPSTWISALYDLADRKGVTLRWVNCGLCADERGVEKAVDGVVRGSPADFHRMLSTSDNALVIGTR